MTALAIITDVEGSLGRSLTVEEFPRATALLALASSHVEAETGYRFSPGLYTVGRKVRDGKVILPARVATVADVREVDQYDGSVAALAGYTLHGRTLYGLSGPRPNRPARQWHVGPMFVEIDFTVTAAVPDDVTGVVAGIVASTMSGPVVGTSAETAGPFSISYVNSSGKVWLSASDKAILGRYKQPKPALDLI